MEVPAHRSVVTASGMAISRTATGRLRMFTLLRSETGLSQKASGLLPALTGLPAGAFRERKPRGVQSIAGLKDCRLGSGLRTL